MAARKPPVCGHRHGPWICLLAAIHRPGRHYYVKAETS